MSVRTIQKWSVLKLIPKNLPLYILKESVSTSDLLNSYGRIVANSFGHHQSEVFLDSRLQDQGSGPLQIHSLEKISVNFKRCPLNKSYSFLATVYKLQTVLLINLTLRVCLKSCLCHIHNYIEYRSQSG